jgi:cytochrome P450
MIIQQTHVTFNQYPAYRQSYNFHAPNSFIPERFLSTNIAADGDDMASFQPFQIGRHACIGINVAWREMRLTVARLLWAFDVRLADEKGDRWDWGTQRTFILWVSLNFFFLAKWEMLFAN